MTKTELRIVYRPIGDLIPYAKNSRTHSEAQVAQIVASIREWGWTNPVLIDGAAGIIAGHGRVLAARVLGETQVPTIELDGMTDAQKRAYIIADNKLAQNAGWDDDLLRIEMADLAEMGFAVDLIGFSADELSALQVGAAGDAEGEGEAKANGSLSDRFMIPPFSVMNAREGWWQDRKRAWLALGIKSELGRGGSAATPPHPPTVTRNADGTLNYGGAKGQSERFDRQRQPGAAPGKSPRPAADYSKKKRGNGAGKAI